MTERESGLPVALFIEGHEHSKSSGIIVLIRTMFDFQQGWGLDAEKNHPVGVKGAIGRNHVKSPYATRIQIDLFGLDGETFRPKPFLYLIRVRPS